METLSSQVTEQQSGGITEMTQSVKKVLDSEVKRVSNVLSDKENDSENDSEDDDYSYEDKQWGDEDFEDDDSFILANLDFSGFYRVNYDENNWMLIIKQLKTNKQVRIFIVLEKKEKILQKINYNSN